MLHDVNSSFVLFNDMHERVDDYRCCEMCVLGSGLRVLLLLTLRLLLFDVVTYFSDVSVGKNP